MKLLAGWVTVTAVVGGTWAAAQADARSAVADRVAKLTRASSWKHVASVPVAFRTFHPQGLVKIGDAFFVSSVEVTVPAKPLPPAAGGYDWEPGEGVGHLFKFDIKGN